VGAADHAIVAEFVGHAGGGKGADMRAIRGHARRRVRALVRHTVVWALDRLSREGMMLRISHLQRFAGLASLSIRRPNRC
jgi:hypothetical protein